MMIEYDKIIIGAGIYGLYAAQRSCQKGEKVLILEYDDEAVSRATYINQARVHNGYHYPRSFSTAKKSANYFRRFCDDFSFAVNSSFKKIYAISGDYSWTSAEQFEKFCTAAKIKCHHINDRLFFREGMVDGAFETEEYTFDAMMIKEYFIDSIKDKVDLVFGARIKSIHITNDKQIQIELSNGEKYISPFVLNATYASTNQLIDKMGMEMFGIKYELCEIILCDTTDNIKDVGLTVMDGPFFSVMPFGYTGSHSLTSVTFTPHETCYDSLPAFSCQDGTYCSLHQFGNCNTCPNKPKSAWPYMYKLAKKYLNKDIDLFYNKSLFSVKPILKASEIDDSRPTIIKMHSVEPTFVSVLSGKINTIYDMDEIL